MVDDRCATLKESVMLFEVIPENVWEKLNGSIIVTASRPYRAATLRDLVETEWRLLRAERREFWGIGKTH